MTVASEADERAADQRSAARVAARAQIRDVRLLGGHFGLERLPDFDGQLTYNLDTKAATDYEDGDPFFVVRVRYELEVAARRDALDDGEERKGKEREDEPLSAVASVAFELAGLFWLELREDDHPLADEELEAYAKTTGQFALYPYAREFIYNLTGRLGLPPLTVGVLQLPSPWHPPKEEQ